MSLRAQGGVSFFWKWRSGEDTPLTPLGEEAWIFTFSIDEKVTKNLALEISPILIGLEAKIK